VGHLLLVLGVAAAAATLGLRHPGPPPRDRPALRV